MDNFANELATILVLSQTVYIWLKCAKIWKDLRKHDSGDRS